jgi:hypothetical protein
LHLILNLGFIQDRERLLCLVESRVVAYGPLKFQPGFWQTLLHGVHQAEIRASLGRSQTGQGKLLERLVGPIGAGVHQPQVIVGPLQVGIELDRAQKLLAGFVQVLPQVAPVAVVTHDLGVLRIELHGS